MYVFFQHCFKTLTDGAYDVQQICLTPPSFSWYALFKVVAVTPQMTGCWGWVEYKYEEERVHAGWAATQALKKGGEMKGRDGEAESLLGHGVP